jgi:hypothetical protein
MGLTMSCDNRIGDSVFNPELISEVGQEDLGDQIFDALISDISPYDVLPFEEHELLYKYVDQLYLQSYRILRSSDNWTKSRDWRIAIVREENQGAFTLPGGNIVITTGMLKTFRAEYELYYLLSFENALMNNEDIYFSNIASFIENTIDLEELINNPDRAKALEIGIELYEEQSFSAFDISTIDRMAMELICESGSWRNDGLIQFLTRLNPDSVWMLSRPSVINRVDEVSSISAQLSCNNTIRERTPNFYIDEVLPLIP